MKSFSCVKCGACCSGEGSLFLYPDDVVDLAKNLSLSLQDFVDGYTDFVIMEYHEEEASYSYTPYLILKKRNDSCLFLYQKRCLIHSFKPFQCRNTPFVSEFFSNKEWRNYLKKHCAGLKGMTERDFEQYRHIEKLSLQADRDYYLLLRKNGFNLEKILNVVLPVPKMILV